MKDDVAELDLRDWLRDTCASRTSLLAHTEPVAGLQQQAYEGRPNRQGRRDRDTTHLCIERGTGYPAII